MNINDASVDDTCTFITSNDCLYTNISISYIYNDA